MLKRDSERKTPLVVGMEDVDRYEKEATLQDTLATLIQTDAEVTINYKDFFSLSSPFLLCIRRCSHPKACRGMHTWFSLKASARCAPENRFIPGKTLGKRSTTIFDFTCKSKNEILLQLGERL